MNKHIYLVFFVVWSLSANAQIKQISEKEIESQTSYIAALNPALVGEEEKAIDLLESFAQKHPTEATVFYKLARLYRQEQQMKDAFAAIEKATTLAPKQEWFWIEKAEICKTQNNWACVENTYAHLASMFPNKSNYAIAVAHAELEQGEHEKCLQRLQDLENRIGITEDVSRKKYSVYKALEQYDKAEAEIQQLIRREPDNTDYLLILAQLYAQSNQPTREIEMYKRILTIDPNESQARIQLSELTSESGGEILRELQAVIKDSETSIDLKVQKLIPFLQAVDPGDSVEVTELIDILQALVQTHPRDAKAYTMLADGYYNAGLTRQSLPHYEKAMELQPDVFTVWHQHVKTLHQLEDYTECIERVEEALIYFPNQVDLYLWGADAALRLNQKQQAATYLAACSFMLEKDEILFQYWQVLSYLAEANQPGLKEWMEQQHNSQFILPEAAITLLELAEITDLTFLAQIINQANGPLAQNYLGQLAAAFAEAEQNNWANTRKFATKSISLGGAVMTDNFHLLRKVGEELQEQELIQYANKRLQEMGVKKVYQK